MKWKTKLSSRKLWVAIIGFVTAMMMAMNATPDTIEKAVAVIMAGGVLVSYILAEGWIDASRWSHQNVDAWVDAYYVKRQNLKPADARKIVESEGAFEFPLLASLIAKQQSLIDVIHEAGDLPKRLDAREEFDLRFDAVIAAKTN